MLCHLYSSTMRSFQKEVVCWEVLPEGIVALSMYHYSETLTSLVWKNVYLFVHNYTSRIYILLKIWGWLVVCMCVWGGGGDGGSFFVSHTGSAVKVDTSSGMCVSVFLFTSDIWCGPIFAILQTQVCLHQGHHQAHSQKKSSRFKFNCQEVNFMK